MTGQELLNAMIANYVQWFGVYSEPYEDQGRFDTLVHALTVVHPDRTPEWAQTWLTEHIDELRLSRIDD